MEKKAIWEDWVNLLLGAWVFFLPWTVTHSLPGSVMSAAMLNFFAVGLIVFVSAAMALNRIKPWEEWTNLIAGLWLFFSPWMFGYANQSGLVWNSVIVGLSIFIFSGLALPVARKSNGLSATI